MENYLAKRQLKRSRRVLRIRKHVRGDAQKPRLSVSKTNRHLFAQLIDDERGVTLASVGTAGTKVKRNKETGKKIGLELGQLAGKQNIGSAVFDRGRFKYHGVIAAIADGAREAGLKF
jgi:large subunit ribosomal protein L18